ncbi:MAG: TetR/AcrR family transcriptional regulator [Actinomycetota bacterium]
MAATETRRERQRRELTAEIVAVARRQLAEGGRAAVSWRGIAREVGMNPASLYTYFASLDDLFTALILESYGSLAAAVRPSADEPPGAGLEAYCRAYLAWAFDNPSQFNLIWTDQLPGYEAPPGGPTVEAETEVIAPLVAVVGAARGEEASMDELATVDADVLNGYLSIWGTLHGLVTLLVNNHLPFVEDPERLVVGQVVRSVEALGDTTSI